MQWSLFLLLLMGQSFFLTCGLYEFHFINVNKTWEEAQAYCRESYTDLAKVFDLTDMRRLQSSTQYKGEAWIGLYSKPGKENRTWHWSLPGVEEYSEKQYSDSKSWWGTNEPNDGGGTQNCENSQSCQNCVFTTGNWVDDPCSHTKWFICYDETMKNNKTFHVIYENKNWTQAQSYCRVNHTDLVSGLHQINSTEFKELNRSAGFWIGLFRDTWRWSDGSKFSFRHWDMDSFNDGLSTEECATTLLDRSGRWSSDGCNQTKPFFCYEDKVILIKESRTWEEALYYCREKHHDLVSISSSQQQGWVQEKAKNASTPFVWLGLRYTCTLGFWFWVTDETVTYNNWDSNSTDDCNMSGAMASAGSHAWSRQPDDGMFNFFCSKY
ncbi:C-type mannose receptor 2-like [Archocentrus centrarchus]|uniref:C-type mannose receptor 2-like n=1 Tax=Archocentrus centrarchus TaxID=63155 RepID=UPI0011E9F53A|nr:C-type mannose receptor 2-like [Archocentrus centrarchus]